MKKIYSVILCSIFSFLVHGQKTIIVGPQNDCATKKISRNVHTSSAFLELGNSNRLKITTVQHRTFDASRIYDQNGTLIWEWKGESRSDTWYTKEHFLTVNSAKIKVEFTQGFSDPFCNGYIKVEVIDNVQNSFQNTSVNATELNNSTIVNQENSSVNKTETPLIENVFVENQKIIDTKLNLTYEDFKNALNLYYFAYQSKLEVNLINFNPMKLLINRGVNELTLEKEEQLLVDILSGKSPRGPSSYGGDSPWRLNVGGKISKRFLLDSKKIISNFTLEVHMQLSVECKECDKLIEKYFDLFKTSWPLSETEFQELKSSVEKCKYQQFDNLKKKSRNYLDILSGIEPGGPSSYGADSKYRLNSKSPLLKPLSIIDSKKLDSGDILIKTSDGYGVSSSEGYVFIKPIYEKIELINYRGEYVYLATENGVQGIIGFSGELKLDFEYDKIITNANNQFVLANIDKKWWILDDEFFTPKSTLYDDVFVINKLFVVKQNDLFGFLNKDGKVNGTIKYDSVNKIESNNSIIAIKFNDKWGFVSLLKARSAEIDDQLFKYSAYEIIDNNEFILVRSNDKLGFVDRRGKELFAPLYNEYKMDGKDRIFLASNSGWGIYSTEASGFNESGGVGVSNNHYQSVERFINKNYYLVELNNKFGLLNLNGNEFVKPQFDKIFEIQFDAEFQDTFIIVSSNNKFGSVSLDIINEENIHTVPIQFLSIHDVKNEWQKNKNALIQRKREEENRIRLEQERILQEQERIRQKEELAKINEEKKRIERERIANQNAERIRQAEYAKEIARRKNEVHICQYCSQRFTGLGFSCDNRDGEIWSGSSRSGGFAGKIGAAYLGVEYVPSPGDFCSPKCAHGAYLIDRCNH
jgi:hypothetical protein